MMTSFVKRLSQLKCVKSPPTRMSQSLSMNGSSLKTGLFFFFFNFLMIHALLYALNNQCFCVSVFSTNSVCFVLGFSISVEERRRLMDSRTYVMAPNNPLENCENHFI